jgi:aryl-alcohol dehydrogenase-like predicted oxidoreductase
MKFLHVPALGRNVSRLGIGSIKFDTDFQGETASLLDAYQDAGGNLVDTAEIYGRGKSEQAIGNYLKSRGTREQWVVLTKACVNPSLVRPNYIRNAVPRSLDRLQTDYIDLFVLHRDDPSVPVGELVDVMHELLQEKLVLAYGVSNWTVARLAEAVSYAQRHARPAPCLSSPHLGLATPNEPTWAGCTHATAQDLAWHYESGIPIFGWSAQCRGFFAPDSSPTNTEDADLVRVYHSPSNFRKLARARELARAKGVEPVQIALAWVLNQRAATVALVGPNTVSELATALGSVNIELDANEIVGLEDL